jgi:hypothetical protein
MIKVLSSRLAHGVVEREKDLVEIEVLPGPIVERAGARVGRQSAVVGSDALEIHLPHLPLDAQSAGDPERGSRSRPESRQDQHQRAECESAEQVQGSRLRHEPNLGADSGAVESPEVKRFGGEAVWR